MPGAGSINPFCMIYADTEGLDQPKLLRMALIHDLPEAIIGDLTPSKKTKESRERENTALKQILDLLPKNQRKKYMTDWNEYQEGKTKEAKAVRQLEKIEMALQAKEYKRVKSIGQSLERYIKCAHGLCGSCSIGPYRVCIDGPVFDSERLREVRDAFGSWKMDPTGRIQDVDI